MFAQIVRFGLVGILGFVIDASILLALTQFGADPLPARVASFAIAATTTFLVNHRFTFEVMGEPQFRHWSLYLAATGIGALINVGVFHLWISNYGHSRMQLVAGTVVGSLAAMTINFTVARFVVFRTHSTDSA